jgi:hypothetical protein
MSGSDQTALVWHAYEYTHTERETDWYWAVGIIAVSIALTAIIFGDVLFAIIVLIGLFILATLAKHPPLLTRFEITSHGVRIGEYMHRFEDIASFNVLDEHEYEENPILIIATKKLMAPFLVIPIRHVTPAEIRAFLKEHTKQAPLQEPVGHKILQYFGF